MTAAAAVERTAGPAAIRAAFDAAAEAGRAALVPYVVCGRPSIEEMPALVASLADAGADVVELGVPFSDPLADGPVIRVATRRALDAGVDVPSCLAVARATRAAGTVVPIVLMGYVNPLLSYGIDRFCDDAAAAGVDGLIVPDVPLEAAGDLRAAADRAGVALTFLVTPLTDEERLRELAAASTGFLYAVAATGTTGARSSVAGSTLELLDRARVAAAGTPVAVGFGVSSPEHVRELAPRADGVIVGSALVDLVERAPGQLPATVRGLRAATVLPT